MEVFCAGIVKTPVSGGRMPGDILLLEGVTGDAEGRLPSVPTADVEELFPAPAGADFEELSPDFGAALAELRSSVELLEVLLDDVSPYWNTD
jgi:hypothetical protein